MSNKFKRKGRAKFVMLERYLFQSPAFRSLTPLERCAYIELKWRFDGLNNGRIAMSCRELAAALGCSKSTASRALEVLQERGFIEVSMPSAFHLKSKVSASYRLTELPCDVTGELPTKTFMKPRFEEKNSVASGGQTVPSEGHRYPERGSRCA